MSKYIEEARIEARKSLPALESLGLESLPRKVDTSGYEIFSNAIGQMANELRSHKKNLLISDLRRKLVDIDMEASAKVRELPAGWTANQDGINSYNAILQEKIDRKKALLDDHRNDLDEETYDNFYINIGQGATRDLDNYIDLKNKEELRTLSIQMAETVGNTNGDIGNYMAEEMMNNEYNGRPTYVISEETKNNIENRVLQSIETIKNNPMYQDIQKKTLIKNTISSAYEQQTKGILQNIFNSKDPEFQVIGEDGKAIIDPSTGSPVLNEKAKQDVIYDLIKKEKDRIMGDEYLNKLQNEYGISKEEAEDIRSQNIAVFKKIEDNTMLQIQARATNEAQKNQERENMILREESEAYQKAVVNMSNTMSDGISFIKPYSEITGRAFDYSQDMDSDGQPDGKGSFERFYGVDFNEMNKNGKYIPNFLQASQINTIKSFADGNDLGWFLYDNIYSNLETEKTKKIASRSIAASLASQGLELNSDAIEILADPKGKEKDLDGWQVANSIFKFSKSQPFVPKIQGYKFSNRLDSTYTNMKQKFGGAEGMNAAIKFIFDNQDAFKQTSEKFNEGLQLATASTGKINEDTLYESVVSAYADDQDFRDLLDSYANYIYKYSRRSFGSPMRITDDVKDRIIKDAGLKAADRIKNKYKQLIPNSQTNMNRRGRL